MASALPYHTPRSIGRTVSRMRMAVRAYVLIEGLAALVILLGTAFWIGLMLDWWLEPPAAVRGAAAAVLAIGTAVVAWRYILRRTFASLRSDSLALLIERKHPQLNEGLVTSVQMAAEGADDGAQRTMLESTARRTADALGDVRLGRVFDFQPLVAKVVFAAALTASIGLFAATQRDAFGFWLQRMRLSSEPWPRTVALSVVGFDPTSGRRAVNVARDDSYELQVLASIVDDHRAPAEVEVRWRMADGRRGRGPMLRIGEAMPGRDEAQLYRYTFKVSSDIEFDVIGGDDRVRGLRLHPVERPAIKELAVACRYPAYLQRDDRRIGVSSGRIELPSGSTASCLAAATKPLVGVTVHDPAEQLDLPAVLDPEDRTQFHFELGRLSEDRVLLVTMADVDGVSNRDPFRLSIVTQPDEPPEVNVQLRGIGTAVTPQARIPLLGRIVDDHALVDAWFEYIVDDAKPERRLLQTQPTGLASMRMTEPFDLAETDAGGSRPLVELEPGQSLTLSVAAQDAFDLGEAPHVGRSSLFQLDVVTASELRALLEKRELGLRQRFEAIYEKMLGVRDLIDRIDLAAGGGEADDSDDDADEASPDRARQQALARIGGAHQSATQLAFETSGVADGFADILAELVNNRVDTQELTDRLEQGISSPLREIGADMLPRFDDQLGALRSTVANESQAAAAELAAARAEAQAICNAMKTVLDRMLELESYNELVELMRGIVADHEELRDATRQRQREILLDLED